MKIIPVIDVMDGVVVHGIGGRRDDYRPVKSAITDSTEPRKVAEAMLAATGSDEIYIADLDAIRGDGIPRPVVLNVAREISATVWLDHGVRTGGEVPLSTIELPNINIVAGSETCRGPGTLRAVMTRLPLDRIAFSVDMFDGYLMGEHCAWGIPGLRAGWELAEAALELGIRNLIVLDLADIGRESGKLRARMAPTMSVKRPGIRIITGGGVRNRDDLDYLARQGVDAVLIATAIHNGTFRTAW